METILFIVCLAIVVAAVCGKGPAEPPIYRIELVPPVEPRGHGHLVAVVVLMLLIVLILAAGSS
jgi:hypothetical protein